MRQPITIDRAGRIVLPIDVRRRLNLGPGARLTLDVVAGHVELTPLPQTDTELLVTPGRRTVLRPTGTPFDAAAATRAERQVQAERGGRR